MARSEPNGDTGLFVTTATGVPATIVGTGIGVERFCKAANLLECASTASHTLFSTPSSSVLDSVFSIAAGCLR